MHANTSVTYMAVLIKVILHYHNCDVIRAGVVMRTVSQTMMPLSSQRVVHLLHITFNNRTSSTSHLCTVCWTLTCAKFGEETYLSPQRPQPIPLVA